MGRPAKPRFSFPIQIDWEAPDFLKTSLRLLDEAEAFDLFREDSKPRQFREELLHWVERWKQPS